MLNGMGTFGLLGNLILPGGPIGGAIVGSALGMLNQSDKFKDWLFGKTDDNGERTGGIISKQMQDFVKSNKTEIIGGAALGTMKSMLLGGSGVLSSIVGGPMAGALWVLPLHSSRNLTRSKLSFTAKDNRVILIIRKVS